MLKLKDRKGYISVDVVEGAAGSRQQERAPSQSPGLVSQQSWQNVMFQKLGIPQHEVDSDGLLVLPDSGHIASLQRSQE